MRHVGTAALGVACVGGQTLLPGCAAYVEHTLKGRTAIIKKTHMTMEKHALINPENLPAPLYISRLENGSFAAVLMLCTHKRCTLHGLGDTLECPCHGSEFSQTGSVLSPPAERDLRRFEVSEDDEHIYIKL